MNQAFHFIRINGMIPHNKMSIESVPKELLLKIPLDIFNDIMEYNPQHSFLMKTVMIELMQMYIKLHMEEKRLKQVISYDYMLYGYRPYTDKIFITTNCVDESNVHYQKKMLDLHFKDIMYCNHCGTNRICNDNTPKKINKKTIDEIRQDERICEELGMSMFTCASCIYKMDDEIKNTERSLCNSYCISDEYIDVYFK